MAPWVSERGDHGAGKGGVCVGRHRCGRVIDAESLKMRFEHGIKGNALNDHCLSLAATAFSLAETALLLERMYKAGDSRRATIVWVDFGKGECH